MHRESLLEMRLKYMWKKTCELEFTWLFLFVKQSLAIHKIHIQLSSVKQKVVAMDEVWRGSTCRKLAWILPVVADPPIGEHPPQSRQYASIAATVSQNLNRTSIGWFLCLDYLNWVPIELQLSLNLWAQDGGPHLVLGRGGAMETTAKAYQLKEVGQIIWTSLWI